MLVTRDENPSEFVCNTYNAVKQWRTPYESRWKRFYKLYRSWRDVTSTPFKSNIFVPYIFSIVESVVPKMLGAIFNTRPIISVMARKGVSEDMAMLLEHLLEYQFDEEQLELFSKILEFFKETSIYGTSFAKIIPKFNDDDAVSFNFIDVEPLDLFNVFPDYRAKSIRRMKYIITLSYVDYDELERLYNQGFYENIPELLNHTESLANVDSFKKERLSSVGIMDEYGFDNDRRIVEVLEYWDRDKIIVVGAKNFILKIEDNPFGGLLPFIMARYIPVQHELYGIGIPEVSENLQEELNSVRNQRMDNVNLIINRMWIANKYAEVDFDNMISYPGNIILSNNVDAIKPLDTRDVTKSAYQEEDIIKRDIDNACFDIEDVDVLTRYGWKPFKETTYEDEIATRTKEGLLEYNKPEKILIFEEKEQELIRFKSNNIDGDYTPDHKFPVIGWTRGNYKYKNGKPGQKDKEFIYLQDVTPYSNYKIPLTAKWQGTYIEEKILSNGLRIPIDDWVAFLGIYLAEGSAQGTKGGLLPEDGAAHRITISQKLDSDKAEQIRQLLNKIGFKYSEQGHQFVLYSKPLWEELYPLGNSFNKYVPQEIKDLPIGQLQILFDWMCLGDGSKFQEGKTLRTKYYTASKKLIDDVQEIIIKLGMVGTVALKEVLKNGEDFYQIEAKHTKFARFQHKGQLFLSPIKKTCRVGCFHIKHQTFMIRINGKAFWTGNTGEYEYSRGATPPHRETATGIVRLQQASNIRFDTVVKMLEFTVLRNMAKMFLWLDYHFLPPEEFAKIVGFEEFERMQGISFYQQDINDMLKQYNFQPMGSSTTAIKEVRIQQIMQAYKLFNQDPYIDQVELRKMVLDVLDIKNINRLLRPDQAQQIFAQRQAMAQQEAATGQGGGKGPGVGKGGPSVPPVAPPGSPPMTGSNQLAELMRIAGGGLLNRATGGPQPVSPAQPGVVKE